MTAPLKLTPGMDTATMVDAINQNFRQIEAESRRKVVTDEDGNDRIIIGRREDGTYGIDVSLDGIDANGADQNDLVMSSDFNMWKIIRSGNITAWPNDTRRSGTLSLNTTNMGYVFNCYIKLENFDQDVEYGETWTGNLLLNLRDNTTKEDMSHSGIFYDDGTNRLFYNMRYYLLPNTQYLLLQFNLRCWVGSYTFSPRDETPVFGFYYQIANPTRNQPFGMGGGGTGTGKYIYVDTVVFDESGTQTGALESQTYQFLTGDSWQKFPYQTPRFFHSSML